MSDHRLDKTNNRIEQNISWSCPQESPFWADHNWWFWMSPPVGWTARKGLLISLIHVLIHLCWVFLSFFRCLRFSVSSCFCLFPGAAHFFHGQDPFSRRAVWELLRSMKQQRVTVGSLETGRLRGLEKKSGSSWDEEKLLFRIYKKQNCRHLK